MRIRQAAMVFLCASLAFGLDVRSQAQGADDPVFSGPQVGEKLTPFTVRGVYDETAGQDLDFVTKAGGRPILLIFVHEANRPSVAMTRALVTFARQRSKDLAVGVVWLADDPTASEAFLKRARHAMADSKAIGTSKDGKEGPGAYGLNRNVTLTILVAEKNIVTANYALVQPSLQADAPKIFADVVKLIGGRIPTLKELGMEPGQAMRPQAQGADASNPEAVEALRPLLRPVIRRDAKPEEVDRAAAAVEKHVANNEAARRELGRIGRTIVKSGKLGDYGTPKAQEYLRKWAASYGGEPAPESKPRSGENKR